MKRVLIGLVVFSALYLLPACQQHVVSVDLDPGKSAKPEKQTASEKPVVLKGDALYRSDKAPDSLLYDLPQPVMENVWSAIGALSPFTYENSGHNNNLSFVATSEGVLVVNAGATYLLAKALHDEIKKRTDQPVKYVILENGQSHAALGSNYWQEQGAIVIAHEDAANEIKENSFALLDRVKRNFKEKAAGTVVVAPDEVFKDKKIIEMGGVRFEMLHLGPTHSPGDIVVWLPQKSLVISGDMAFHQRMLPLFDHTDTAGWLETWEKFAALNAEHVIPGHGGPTNMGEVTRYTKDYIKYLRTQVAELLEKGGTLQDAYKIDQSAYLHLPTSELLAKRNAAQVFQMMEFE